VHVSAKLVKQSLVIGGLILPFSEKDGFVNLCQLSSEVLSWECAIHYEAFS
jgi:hypothetical protein